MYKYLCNLRAHGVIPAHLGTFWWLQTRLRTLGLDTFPHLAGFRRKSRCRMDPDNV